jgi:hypothetical protein
MPLLELSSYHRPREEKDDSDADVEMLFRGTVKPQAIFTTFVHRASTCPTLGEDGDGEVASQRGASYGGVVDGKGRGAAAAVTRGSSGLGSVNSEQMLSSTLEMVSAAPDPITNAVSEGGERCDALPGVLSAGAKVSKTKELWKLKTDGV